MISKKLIIAGGSCFAICVLVMSITLISLSIKTVEPEEYAVVYDSIWKFFDTDILVQGRYTLRPTSTLITFPNVFKPIDFTSADTDINCVSRDGIIINIDVVTQYRYLKVGLIDTLYMFDNTMLPQFMTDMSRSAFINTCTLYEIESGFINQRQNISDTMKQAYKDKITYTKVSSETQYAELRNYDYSKDYSDAITNKQIAQQQIDLLLSKRNVQLTDAKTTLINAEKNSDISLQRATTQVESILVSAQNDASAIETKWIQYADGFKNTLNNLKMDADTFVSTYMIISPIDDPTNSNTVYVSIK